MSRRAPVPDGGITFAYEDEEYRLVFLIQAGLQEHHRGATLDEAARMAASAEAIEALCATIEEDMPQGDRKETPRGNGPARPSRRGTGTRSSARRSKSG